MSVISTLNFAVEEAAKEQTNEKLKFGFVVRHFGALAVTPKGIERRIFFVFASRQSVICTQKRSEEKAVILLERIKKRTPEKLSKIQMKACHISRFSALLNLVPVTKKKQKRCAVFLFVIYVSVAFIRKM